LAFLGLGLIVVAAGLALHERDLETRRAEAELAVDQSAKRLQELVQTRVFAIEILGRAALRGEVDSDEAFRGHSRSVIESFPGLVSTSWIEPGGVVRCVSPTVADDSFLGSCVLESPIAKHAIDQASLERSVQITPPEVLEDGGQVISAYYPLLDESGAPTGFLRGCFSFSELCAGVLEDDTWEDYEILVRDGESKILDTGSWDEVRPEEVVTASFDVFNREWVLEAAPRGPLPSVAGLDFATGFLGLGLLLSLSVSIALHFWIGKQRNRQRMITERAELESRLLQAEKMEAVGRLAGGVAHDFNNLLTAILGNADLLETFSSLDPDSRSALDQIRIAGERATQLTTQLLTISRRQVVQPRVIDLNQELETLQGVLRRLVRENVELVEELTDDPCFVELDPGHLSQIAINLVVNAVDVMPTGGRITMRTELKRTELAGVVRDWVVLSVADTGAGMDELTQQRALEPFFTTKEQGKGTGLGLATVDGITTGAGGSVKIEHNEPCGTRISVWLPASERRITSPAQLPPAELKGGTALVVEDEPSVLAIASRILTRAGYEVISSENGQEALELVNRGQDFDLLFTDAVMPKLGGRDLLENLRSRDLDFIAVITSGYPDELDGTDLDRLQAAFLNKPFTEQSLRAAVSSASELASVGLPD